jgi:uncharacterized protein DUF6279
VIRRALRLVVIAAAALAIGSCSLSRLAYTNAAFAYMQAPPVIAWMVGDYVDMSDGQKNWVRERLLRAFAWHRAQELPEYRRFFERVLDQARNGISPEEARLDYTDLRAYYHRSLERLLPDLADFLLQLDAEQLQQLESRFEKDNRKILKESVEGTPEERREKRYKRYVDNIEEFTGRLGEAQRDIIAASVGAMAELEDERVADRRYRQSAILALMRSSPARERVIAELKRLLIDTDSWRRADYVAKLRKRDQLLFDMVSAVSLTLTNEQRAHFQKRVRGFMSDIAELTASR